MRQEGVLLALVEAVHLIHEDDGAPALGGGQLRALDGLADLADATQHGRDGDELRVKGARHQARQRGLAHARRAPKDHGLQPPGLKGHPQRHAGAEQMALADDLIQLPGTQSLGQGAAARRPAVPGR